MTDHEPTKCGGCGVERNIPVGSAITNCPHCGSSMLVTNLPIIVTTAPTTFTWPK